jgi:hypothetical protein
MTDQPRKMSEILEEMANLALRQPSKAPSEEAAQVALFFANVAWNESVGLTDSREGGRHVWKTIEADNPQLWKELKSNDVNALIDDLVQYKKTHYPDDRRRILTCGSVDGKIRVEWLRPAPAGVDPRWEMQLYGLVRTGRREEAIRFLQVTRATPREDAEARVAQIAASLGIA